MDKDMKAYLVIVAAMLVILGGLGLVVAGVVAPAINGDPCWYLKRHTLALAVGFVSAVAAAMIPWQRWLNAAPWLFAIWLFFFWSSSVLFYPINGEYRYVILGPIRIDTWTLGWPVAGLFIAWLRTKLHLRSRWLLMALVLGAITCITVKVVSAPYPYRITRLQEVLGFKEPSVCTSVQPADIRALEQEIGYDAWRSSKWIGRRDESKGIFVPNGHKSNVLSGVAVSFGKISTLSIWLLFVAILATLKRVWCLTADAAGRLFLLVYGLWLCMPAVHNLAALWKLVPNLGLGLPLVSVGTTSVMVACVGFGLVCSMTRAGFKAKNGSV